MISAAPPVVELRGITKRFGAFAANDSIDLTLRPGEIHALLGENGAGKSTLVKILYGLLQPDAGEIMLRGKVVAIASPADARRRGIGMVFQHFSLFEQMSVLENIALGMEAVSADSALDARVRQVSREYGMPIEPGRPVWSLSAGERQRIEIIRVLMQSPDVIILDEPTSVLTPSESDSLFATLERLRGAGRAVLFISHKLDEVRRHCDAATILRGGRRVGTTNPRAETPASLARLMVGEAVQDISPRTNAMTGAPALQATDAGLAKAHLHGVDLAGLALQARAGEIVGIAGIAGNGQSELFALLSGEALAASGRITMAGTDVTRQGINARRRLGAAFVPEERLGHGCAPGETLSQNLLLSWHASENIAPRGLIDSGRLRAASADVVKRFDVRASGADPAASRLSGGNLQKFIMGREMARAPKLLVVNQPTWGIDAAAAAAIRRGLLDLATAGAAVVLISQDLDELLEVADRILVINAGRLLAPGDSKSRDQIGLLMTGGTGPDGAGARHAA